MDRPIFYSVAVILAGYLPIYALTGPSGKLFVPMAETMSYALLGSLIFTLTLVPVLASYWFKNGVKEVVNRPYEWVKRIYAGRARLVPGPSENDDDRRDADFRRHAAFDSLHRRRVHAAPGRRRAVGARHHAVHDFLRGSGEVRAANPQHPDVLSAGDGSRLGIGAPGRWHRSHRIFQLRILRRAEAVQGQGVAAGTDPKQGGAHRRPAEETRQPIPA